MPDRIVVKWSRRVLDEGFVAFPKRLLRALPKMFSGATALDQLRVVLAVADYRRPNQTRVPSLGLLAFVAGMTNDDFRHALEQLINRGLVTVNGGDDALSVSLDPLLDKIMKETTEKS